ncbi:glutathione S-transferase [Orussus abietinus]|uniref:glutathione S-transferase n=1 Tax=Orussus abietinus TaxID=222816 RepID=UPI000626B486|nr:glutathione S-transferase [Orussus abietinus]XP_023290534.1 glutathione S-transferase [Orussus abietinus]
MTRYRLLYFDIMGLGEPIRFLLSYGDFDFEDVRLDRGEAWAKIKSSMPFGQVPVLEIDGKKYSQTLPICRYLAKKLDLLGDTDLDVLQVDSAAEAIHELRKQIALFFREDDPVQKAKKKAETVKNTAPFYLNRFEDLVKSNDGYFHGGKLSYADIYFVAILDFYNYCLEFDVTKDRPHLRTLKEKVQSIPKIKEWLNNRPKRNF